jgi:putative intracellular protease/amidase
MSRVLIPLPACGFDPTEAGVAWKVLSERGHEVVFATPDGKPASADPIMVTGKGLGLLKAPMTKLPEARSRRSSCLGATTNP